VAFFFHATVSGARVGEDFVEVFLFVFLVWFGFVFCYFVSVFVFFIKNVFRGFGLRVASERLIIRS